MEETGLILLCIGVNDVPAMFSCGVHTASPQRGTQAPRMAFKQGDAENTVQAEHKCTNTLLRTVTEANDTESGNSGFAGT